MITSSRMSAVAAVRRSAPTWTCLHWQSSGSAYSYELHATRELDEHDSPGTLSRGTKWDPGPQPYVSTALRSCRQATGLLGAGSVTTLRVQQHELSASQIRHYAVPGSLVYELKELAKLHAEGGLTDREYKDAKAAVISDKKNIYFTGGRDGDRQSEGASTSEVKLSAPTDSAVDESLKEKKKARSANFNKLGRQAVTMAGLTDEAQGEIGLGQALVSVAQNDQPREMPGGGAGFAVHRRTGGRRLDDAEREHRIGAGAVLRARAAEKQAAQSKNGGLLEDIDQRLAAELGVSLSIDAGPDEARTGTYYLRIACRMIGVPGQAMSEVSTNTPKRLLDECGLSYASMTPDVPGECVVVVTTADTSEALVLSTIATIKKANGSPTFGPQLADPVMYRVERIP